MDTEVHLKVYTCFPGSKDYEQYADGAITDPAFDAILPLDVYEAARGVKPRVFKEPIRFVEVEGKPKEAPKVAPKAKEVEEAPEVKEVKEAPKKAPKKAPKASVKAKVDLDL